MFLERRSLSDQGVQITGVRKPDGTLKFYRLEGRLNRLHETAFLNSEKLNQSVQTHEVTSSEGDKRKFIEVDQISVFEPLDSTKV